MQRKQRERKRNLKRKSLIIQFLKVKMRSLVISNAGHALKILTTVSTVLIRNEMILIHETDMSIYWNLIGWKSWKGSINLKLQLRIVKIFYIKLYTRLCSKWPLGVLCKWTESMFHWRKKTTRSTRKRKKSHFRSFRMQAVECLSSTLSGYHTITTPISHYVDK